MSEHLGKGKFCFTKGRIQIETKDSSKPIHKSRGRYLEVRYNFTSWCFEVSQGLSSCNLKRFRDSELKKIMRTEESKDTHLGGIRLACEFRVLKLESKESATTVM